MENIIPAAPEKKNPVKFTPEVAQRSYLTGGWYLSAETLNTLTYQSDEMTKRFGDEILNKMLRDPEIKKCVTVLKINVLGDGVSFYPAVSKPSRPPEQKPNETPEEKKERIKLQKEQVKYEKAKEYSDFLNRSLTKLEKPIRDTLFSMLDSMVEGNKVAEKTYGTSYDSVLKKDVLIVQSIRVKPRSSVSFVVDHQLKIKGIKGITYEGKKRKFVILPREKFCILTFAGKDEDPRGVSKLESVYNAWYLKSQLFPEYLRWLMQCAIPGLVGTLPAEDTRKYIIDPVSKEVRTDANGTPLYRDESLLMLETLVQMRNSSAIVIPHGATVTPINNSTSGDPFKGMRDVLNEEIEMGLLLQTLATSDSRHNTRAASTVQMTVLEGYIWFIKNMVMDMLLNDYVKDMMRFNFTDFDEELMPKVSMGDVERRTWKEDLAAAVQAGYSLDSSQFVGLDSTFQMPERRENFQNQEAQVPVNQLNQVTN